MPAKVFISCGQAGDAERRVARQLGEWFSSAGYRSYVAIEVQSILDLNAGIIAELKTSDYYLFINFRRDLVVGPDGKEFHRGSLYTNQELAIAYAFGFDHMLLINQTDAKPEGVFKFIVTNVPEFNEHAEVLLRVQEAVGKVGWSPNYTRQLLARGLRLAEQVHYCDHTGNRIERTLHVDICNERPDIGAVGCVARLVRLCVKGQPFIPAPDRSLIKATGLSAYTQTIWPKSHGAFDLLGISVEDERTVYLHSALDVSQRMPIIKTLGIYQLEYEVFSQGFPTLVVKVLLTLTGNRETTTATLI